eukprot:8435616-Heterocapsa_arctica.AAC.1
MPSSSTKRGREHQVSSSPAREGIVPGAECHQCRVVLHPLHAAGITDFGIHVFDIQAGCRSRRPALQTSPSR